MGQECLRSYNASKNDDNQNDVAGTNDSAAEKESVASWNYYPRFLKRCGVNGRNGSDKAVRSDAENEIDEVMIGELIVDGIDSILESKSEVAMSRLTQLLLMARSSSLPSLKNCLNRLRQKGVTEPGVTHGSTCR